MLRLVRWVSDLLGYVHTWVWLWGVASGAGIIASIWAFALRLPGVLVFVLALGAATLSMIALETGLILHMKISDLRGAKIRAAVRRLARLRPIGTELFNRFPKSGDDIETFMAQYRSDGENLKHGALAAMRGAAPLSRIAWFDSLLSWSGPGFQGVDNEHTVLRNTIHEMLNRMQRISEELEARL